MGRKVATGNFKSREELIKRIVHLYYNTPDAVRVIAMQCGVSFTTVNTILNDNVPIRKHRVIYSKGHKNLHGSFK